MIGAGLMLRRFANLLFPLAQTRAFWRFKALWDRVSFRTSRFMFYRRENLRTSREYIGIFFQIAKGVVLYAAFIIVALACVEFAERFIAAHGWAFGLLKPPADKDKAYSSTDYTLQALTGIQGVFLAVYFTAVSVAASAMYAAVPHEVRILLARDRLGNFFLKYVAACTAVALLLLGYRGLGGTTGKGVLFISVCFGFYSIIAILVVLRESFTLFDPARVGRVIFRDITQAARSASIDGYAWENKPFQASYSNQAVNSLKTLKLLVEICKNKRELGDRPLANLLGDTLSTWAAYAYYRGRIPFASEWYRSIYRHKKWLLAQEFELSLALNTQTVLQPEAHKDRNWLEAELLVVIEQGLLAFVERGEALAAHEKIVAFSNLVRILAGQLDTTNLAAVQAITKKVVDKWSQTQPEQGQAKRTRDEREEIALADLLGMIPIDAALGLGDWAERFDFETFGKRVAETDWRDKKSAYRCGVPYGALELLEEIQEKLAFETLVEGKRISPNWYVEEIILLGILQALKSCLDSIQNAVQTTLVQNPQALFEAKRYRSCTALVLRGLEFVEKYYYTIGHVKKVADGVEQRSKIKDLKWPKFDFDSLAKSVGDMRKELVKLLGKLVPIHSVLPDDQSLPDYFGASYTHVLEETFSALIRDDEAGFGDLYPVAFLGGIAAFDKLQEHVAGWSHLESAVVVKSDVLIDIMEIASYAKFFAEFRGKPAYWDVCTTTWDGYFAHLNKPDESVDYVIRLASFRENQLRLSPRGTYRYHWQQVLGGYLEREGAILEAFYRPGRGGPQHPHPSKLVRRICTTFGMGIDWPGPDIFLIAYFEDHRKSREPIKIRDKRGVRELLGTQVDQPDEDEDDVDEELED